MPERVFSWGEGLDSNLGDSVLRRGLVRRLNGAGPQHVYVGNCSPGYLSGLDLPRDAVVYRKEFRWHLAILRSALVRKTDVHLSPGEAIADRRSIPMRLALAVEAVFLGMRGGGIHQTGVGIRRPVRGPKWPLALTSRLASTLTWRDSWSRHFIGRGNVYPDWAMGEGNGYDRHDSERPYLTISLRGDREWPGEREIRAISELADATNLKVAVVSQVLADDELALHLQSRFDGPAVLWGEGHHGDSERAVRDLYRLTRLLLSDRVHALLIAATELAIPLAFGVASAEKAGRTLAAAGFADSMVSVEDVEAGVESEAIRNALSGASDVREIVRDARNRLDLLAATLPGGGAGRRVRVLHSMQEPDGRVTRYADHMAYIADETTLVEFFSWRRALLGRYDVLHVHWPEYLLRARNRWARGLKALAFAGLMTRISLLGTPVVRTLHNLDAHETGGGVERRLTRWLDHRVRAYISLNAATDLASSNAPVTYIPHGHYVDRFAGHARGEVEQGRLVYFGLIRPYKNVPGLMSAFEMVSKPGLALHVIGKPASAPAAEHLRAQAKRDDRVSLTLEFVDDAQLVKEVTRGQLVVLPYSEMHNSGVLLVALSLGKVVLAPRTPTNEAIQSEVGERWLLLYDGEITADVLVWGLANAAPAQAGGPDLTARDWAAVAHRHRILYREVVDPSHTAPRGKIATP